MNVFSVQDFAQAVRSLSNTARNYECKRKMGQGAREITQDDKLTIVVYVQVAHDFCVKHHFTDGADKTRETLRAIDPQMRGSSGPVTIDYSWAAAELKNVSDVLTREPEKFRFILVSQDRTAYLDDSASFGERVVEAFPSAKDDIRDAGNCLACECTTAAVFHLMRVAEHGLRALAYDRRVRVPKGPIELATWEDVLRELEKSEVAIQGYPKTLAREAQYEFVHGAMMEFKRFKNVYRNRVAHTRDPYDRHQALSVYTHVRSFMQILASHISEGRRTPLKWKGAKWAGARP